MANEEISPSERFIHAIIPTNPVYRQLLGMCPTLAVTAAMKPALTMAGATAFVLICANILTSLIRKLLKPHLRILVFTLTIATFVTIADRFLQAFMPAMSDTLGPYVPLIIVNCLIISRCEACSSKSGLVTSIADAVGMALGFALALASIAATREILGSGTFFEFRLISEEPNASVWSHWGVMILPPGAFLSLGLLLGLAEWIGRKRKEASEGGK